MDPEQYNHQALKSAHFPLRQNVQTALGPTQTPPQWVTSPFRSWDVRLDHSPPSSAKEWCYYLHMALWHGQGQLYLYLLAGRERGVGEINMDGNGHVKGRN